jgi:demethylmenaquinone methyltransferase / 2-methoxy-6-polyprenyl-1,4-benzoquinol methylase
MTFSPRKQHARGLFAGIAGDYDHWAQTLSFGQDSRWHDELVAWLRLPDDALVADVATGTGAIAIALARWHGCRVIGIDQSAEMLATGADRVRDAGLASRIELREGEAERLPLEDESVDALVHSYLLRYVDDPAAVLAELARPIRPGGTMASLEFGVPDSDWYPWWWAWTRIGLPAGGLIAGDGWYETGRFLGPSIERFWREWPMQRLCQAWVDAGMESVRVRRLSVGGGVIMKATKSV